MRTASIICVLAVFSLSFGLLAHYQFLSPYMADYDPYYHIKLALLFRTQGLIYQFPWGAFMNWQEHFVDKAVLYHTLLIPFTYFDDLAIGAKWSAVLFGSLLLTSFYVILLLNRVRFPFFWFLLITASGGIFIFRINVARPQSLSVIFALWCLHCILNNRKRTLAILCYFYALTYPVILPLAFAAINSGIGFYFSRKIDWKTPLITILALLAGLTFNPYFPRTFADFVFPNFYIPLMAATRYSELRMSFESRPLSHYEYLFVASALSLPVFIALVLSLIRPRKLDQKAVSLFWMTLAMGLLTLMIKRFAEYSVPMVFFFLALFFSAHIGTTSIVEFCRRNRFLAACLAPIGLVFLLYCHWNSYRTVAPQFQIQEPELRDAALFLKEKTNAGELVFTCDWDDAPQLFFYNHENRYLVFLDPTFIYIWDPGMWREWVDIVKGNYGSNTYEQMRKIARYGVCTAQFQQLRQIIKKDPRIEILFENKYSYVFRLS